MTAPTTPQVDTDALAEIRGLNYPAPGTQDLGTAGGRVTDYVRRQMVQTEQFAQLKYRQCVRNLLFWDGRQWIDWSRGRSAYVDLPEWDGEVRTTINYIRPILRSLSQRVLSADFTWQCEPRTNAYEERDRATVTERLLTSRYEKTDMDGKVRSALDLAYNCGVAYLKSYWNPAIGPRQTATVTLPHPATGALTDYPVSKNGAPLMDEEGNPLDNEQAFVYRPGDTDTVVRTIFNIRLNPGAFGLNSDEGFVWLLDSDMRSIARIKEEWGPVAKQVTSVQTGNLTTQYQKLVSALGPGMFGSIAEPLNNPDDPETLYVEYWEDRSTLFPEGRLCVVAGDVLLYDGPLPQGQIPHTAVYDERRPFDGTGRARVDDLIAPQMTLNTEVSALLTQNRREGIDQWIGFDIPGLFDQLSSVTGAHVKVPTRGMAVQRSIGDLIARVPATPVNQNRIAAIEMAMRQMFDIGSYHEIQRGQVPPGVDSGIAVQLLQESENAQLNDTVRQLQLSLIRWGRQQLTLARWGYGDSEQRWLPAGDASQDYLVEAVSGPDLPDPEDVDIKLQGFQPTSRAAERAEIFQANREGIFAAHPEMALELLDLGRGLKGAYASNGRQYQKARRENMALERGEFFVIPAPDLSPLAGTAAFMHVDGGPFLLPTLDDHARHIEVHNEIALDDTKPWPIREAVILHINEHQSMMGLQAAQSVQMQQALDPKSTPNQMKLLTSGQPTEEAPV